MLAWVARMYALEPTVSSRWSGEKLSAAHADPAMMRDANAAMTYLMAVMRYGARRSGVRWRCELPARHSAVTMYCSSLPSGIQNVLMRNVFDGVTTRYRRAVMPPRSDCDAC